MSTPHTPPPRLPRNDTGAWSSGTPGKRKATRDDRARLRQNPTPDPGVSASTAGGAPRSGAAPGGSAGTNPAAGRHRPTGGRRAADTARAASTATSAASAASGGAAGLAKAGIEKAANRTADAAGERSRIVNAGVKTARGAVDAADLAQKTSRAVAGDVTSIIALAKRAARNKTIRRSVTVIMSIQLALLLAVPLIFASLMSASSNNTNNSVKAASESTAMLAASASGVDETTINALESITDGGNVPWTVLAAIGKTGENEDGDGPYGLDLCRADLDGDGVYGNPDNLDSCDDPGSDGGEGDLPLPEPGPIAPGEFRISTFNMLGNHHTEPGGKLAGMDSGAVRARRAVELLNRYKVSIVGLQEFQGPQQEAFAAATRGTWDVDENTNRALHNHIAWRVDTWTALQQNKVMIPYFNGRRLPMPYLLMQHKPTGNKVWVINVHNPADTRQYHNQGQYRRAAEAIEIRLINHLHSTGVPVILTGDMNDRTKFICNVAPKTNMRPAYGGSGPCPEPRPSTIDWILGTKEITWTSYVRDRSPFVRSTTDHPVFIADGKFTGAGPDTGVPEGMPTGAIPETMTATGQGQGDNETKTPWLGPKPTGDQDDVKLADDPAYVAEWLNRRLTHDIKTTTTGTQGLDLDAGAVSTTDPYGRTVRQIDATVDGSQSASAQVVTDWENVIKDAPLVGGMSRAKQIVQAAHEWSLGHPVVFCGGALDLAATQTATTWSSPIEGPLPSGAGAFGPRIHPVTGASSFHTGADIGAPTGTPIHAAAAGVVTSAEWRGAFGYSMLSDHGGGVETQYSHMPNAAAFAVKPGTRVVPGQVVGHVGSTGYSTGPHLHFEVHVGGTPVDPVGFLASKGTRYGAKPMDPNQAQAQGDVVQAADQPVSNGTPGQTPNTITTKDAYGRTVTLNKDQLRNAGVIIGVGKKLPAVGDQGLLIALMTALQESSLKMYANSTIPESLNFPHQAVGSDHDSLGLMQQRAGWGSVKERMDAAYNAKAFFGGPTGPNDGSPRGLLDIPGWKQMPPGQAAQKVQVSAFPDAYDKWKPVAEEILARVAGIEPPGTPQDQCGTSATGTDPAAFPGSSQKVEAAIKFALAQQGKPYVWGATGPGSYDCSGLMLRAWEAAGVTLPRVSRAQATAGRHVPIDQMQRGDLVFYFSPISHVGMYLGNGKIIHAPHPGASVTVTDVKSMPITEVRRVG